ncbi:MAG: tetratricopeptide repeat protein [Gammaproteobacteria bacterium]|nr:tetratricopeptide repeat protein [Gammaproteobacteria bacterium]
MHLPDYRLVIRQADENYSARWIDPDGQQSEEFSLRLPLDKDKLDRLRWYLEKYIEFPGAGDHAEAAKLEQKLQSWGKALYDTLFATREAMQVYNNMMDCAENGGCSLTLGCNIPEVLAQPWEMLRDQHGPLGFRGVAVRRQLQGARRNPKYDFKPPLRILLIVARPRDTGFIDPRNSIPPLLDAVDSLGAEAVRLDFCEPPVLAELERRISAARKAEKPFHIVHFDGHGQYYPKTGVGVLCFEDAEEQTHLVSGNDLGDLLSRLNVPLMLLEACRGADLVTTRPVFGSVAPALLQAGVGSVVAFSYSVHIAASRILVQRFYAELAQGCGVGRALEEARAALHADPQRFLSLEPDAETVNLQDWFIPQLYQTGADPVLFSASGAARRDTKAEQADVAITGFPPPPLYSFQGRAHELLELERAFRKYSAVLLHAMGGMGKTALSREAAHWWLRKGVFAQAVFHSFEQYAGAERVVQVLGAALHGENFSSLSEEEQWRTAVRLFRDNKVLLVWDNFESTLPAFENCGYTQMNADEKEKIRVHPRSSAVNSAFSGFSDEGRTRLLQLYRELTADGAQGRLLVTCRPAETGLPGIKEMFLAGLARTDALWLLRAVTERRGIDLERKGYERDQMEELLKRLQDHPLSIELVAPHLRELKPVEIRAQFGNLLAQFADDNSFEGRNRSLLASLNFSLSRLSESAHAALPFLAWFEGGVFEPLFLAFSELDENRWAAARAELEATALLKVEDGLRINDRPYLKLHPTLPFAVQAEAESEKQKQKYLVVYLDMMRTIDNALRGSQPAAGMEIMRREEANFSCALHLAVAQNQHHKGWQLADTLRDYLRRAGRLREHNALTAWVKEHLPQGQGLDEATCASIREHAWSLFTQGQAQTALEQVQDLLQRLQAGEHAGDDPTFQIAMTQGYLGQILSHAGRSDLALTPLQAAVNGYEQLGAAQQVNLSVVLGDLANAYSSLGRFEEALQAAEQATNILRELGRERNIVSALGMTAAILGEAQRYSEAEQRFEEALKAARAIGDAELEGTAQQHLGKLQNNMNKYAQAINHCQAAIRLFQQADDRVSEMQACDLAGTVEKNQGHLDAAQGWYARSRELARELGDKNQLAVVAQNLGVLYQTRAKALEADHPQRHALLRQAMEAVGESLAVWQEMENQVYAAVSHSNLSILHRLLGEWDAAETQALWALEIRESLNHPDVYRAYNSLMEIARARGDEASARAWQAKRDAKMAELERQNQTDDQAVPQEFLQTLLAIANAVYQARRSKKALDPQAAEILAEFTDRPPPFNAISSFLQAIASGQLPAVPAGLPDAITEILMNLREICEGE